MKKKLFGTLFALMIGFLLISGNILASNRTTYGNENAKLINTDEVRTTSEGWLSGWTYRKAHNITGSTAGAQTNYPMVLSVHYDYGFDIEGDVYINYKCRADFGDIRFTDVSGVNLISYWIQQKTDGVQALFWVKIPYIPQNPDCTTIYIYYGNSTASTTSNKQSIFPIASDFEDGTKQGWIISWGTYTIFDGVSPLAFQGNYARMADRAHGGNGAGNGDFYEGFMNSVYLSAGNYRLTCWARFSLKDSHQTPIGIRFEAGGTTVDDVAVSHTNWQLLEGNLTVSTGEYILPFVEFHLRTNGLAYGGNPYFLDEVVIRKWYDPEPTHGTWGTEEPPTDHTPPSILSVEWIPTCPPPLVPAIEPRQGEPILVVADVSDEIGGSGVDKVTLSYRVNSSSWWNNTMTFNATTNHWTTTIPGQLGRLHHRIPHKSLRQRRKHSHKPHIHLQREIPNRRRHQRRRHSRHKRRYTSWIELAKTKPINTKLLHFLSTQTSKEPTINSQHSPMQKTT